MIITPSPISYSGTELEYLLSTIINTAENMFGDRDFSYSVKSIVFSSDNSQSPQIFWDCFDVEIVLSRNSQTDLNTACYELAHETIHLLSPVPMWDVNNLEEGVACYFSKLYMIDVGNFSIVWQTNYQKAFDKVSDIFYNDIHWIRRLRKKQPSLSQITSKLIRDEISSLTDNDIEFLLAKFPY